MESKICGTWVAQLVIPLSSAQVMILELEFQDRASIQAPCSMGSLLLPWPLTPLMLSLSHSLSQIKK